MKILIKRSLMIKTTLIAILFSVLFTATPGFSQTTESGESESQQAIEEAPKVIEQPAYEYYYWPEEDLNNFDLSTMGSGKSGSTLGDKSKRTSNIEANSYLKSQKENQQEKTDSEEGTESTKKSSEPLYVEPVEKPSAQSPSGNPIYEWKDENGTLHMTNDLGKVPPEYQNQFFESEPEGPGQ